MPYRCQMSVNHLESQHRDRLVTQAPAKGWVGFGGVGWAYYTTYSSTAWRPIGVAPHLPPPPLLLVGPSLSHGLHLLVARALAVGLTCGSLTRAARCS